MSKTNSIIKTGDELIITLDKFGIDELENSGLSAEIYKTIKNKKGIYEDIIITVTVKSIEVKEVKEIVSFKNVKVIEKPNIKDDDFEDWPF